MLRLRVNILVILVFNWRLFTLEKTRPLGEFD